MIESFDHPQGSKEWFLCRMGIATASKFATVMANGKDGDASKTRDLYMRQLAGEQCSGQLREDFRSTEMDRGNQMEPELRRLYAMMADVDPLPAGFFKRKVKIGHCGCSPDALIGQDGLAQFKSAAPHVLIDILKAGRVPPQHLPQCQGEMYVTDRQWCDLVIGYTGMPLFRRKIRRDNTYIARLALAIEVFNEELEAMVQWVRNYKA